MKHAGPGRAIRTKLSATPGAQLADSRQDLALLQAAQFKSRAATGTSQLRSATDAALSPGGRYLPENDQVCNSLAANLKRKLTASTTPAAAARAMAEEIRLAQRFITMLSNGKPAVAP